jgi:hypothetical protein
MRDALKAFGGWQRGIGAFPIGNGPRVTPRGSPTLIALDAYVRVLCGFFRLVLTWATWVPTIAAKIRLRKDYENDCKTVTRDEPHLKNVAQIAHA